MPSEKGLRVIGLPTVGCRHCGAQVRTLNEDETVVVYRPATECCYSALEDQIGFCHDEIRALGAKVEGAETNALRLQEDLLFSENPARSELLRRQLARAQAQLPELRARVKVEVEAVSERIKELKRKQEELNDRLGL